MVVSMFCVGLALQTRNLEGIKKSLIEGKDWLRDNSENLESPRHLSLAILGLIAGGDPNKAHHIQRLVTKLREKQITERNSKYGSWSGEVFDTANALLAINKARIDTRAAREVEYLERGLCFLEKNYDQNLKNWLDHLSETIVSCRVILELRDDSQYDNLKNALQWLSTRQCEDNNSFVSTKYTAQMVLLFNLASTELATDEFDESIKYGVSHIRSSADKPSWSTDPGSVSQAMNAIMQSEYLAKVKDPLVITSIDDLIQRQNDNGSWDDSSDRTANCVIAMAEMLGYKIINELKIHYWATCSPISAAFDWEYVPNNMDNPREGRAEGKLIKNRIVGAPQVLVKFPNNISLDTLDAMVTEKLIAVSEAADDVRKRGSRGQPNADEPQDPRNNVLETLHQVGDSLYTLLLQHGIKEKKYEEELSKNKVDHITLEAEYPLSAIPWELIWDRNEFCCLKYSIGRSMGEIPSENINNPNEKIKVLLVGDPSGDLPEVGNEIHAIEKSFDKDWAEVDVYTEENFDISTEKFAPKFLNLLKDGNYDIIHYAGHADFLGEKSYLMFQNPDGTVNDKVSAEDVSNHIQRSDIKPKIVFFNACSSAARDDSQDANKLLFDKNFANLSTDFVKGLSSVHVPAYIGALWPIHDNEAAEFAITFYQSIKKGCTIGDAVRLARIESYLTQPEHLTWASFILYGDPSTRLSRLEEKN